MIIIGPHGRILRVGPAVSRALGYSEPELMAMSPETLISLIHPDDVNDAITQATDVWNRIDEHARFQVRVRHRSDTFVLIEAFVGHLADGPSNGLIVSLRPIIDTADRINQRLALDFLHAVDSNELRLAFQPIVTIDTRETVMLEVLVRWQHPTRGLLAPSSFFDVLEQYGFGALLDLWVLERACQHSVQWGMPVSINIYPQHVRDESFVDDVIAVTERVGIASSQITLEIVESEAISQDGPGLTNLARIRDHGFTVAIDDFGSGYSGLSTLRTYPADVVKIDQQFVKGLNESTVQVRVVQAIVSIAAALNLTTIAEGIESQALADLVASVGCLYGQGYHYSEPVSPEHVPDLLVRFPRRLRPMRSPS